MQCLSLFISQCMIGAQIYSNSGCQPKYEYGKIVIIPRMRITVQYSSLQTVILYPLKFQDLNWQSTLWNKLLCQTYAFYTGTQISR